MPTKSIPIEPFDDVVGTVAPARESRYNTIVATMTGYDFDRYTDGKFDLDVARTSD
jgi:hypothetical protein